MAKSLHSVRHEELVRLLIESRRKAGLTQAELARRLDQHQSFVARLESGERRIDVVEWLELADAIGFDPIKVLKQLRELGG